MLIPALNLFVLTMRTKTTREGLKNKIQLTCKYKRNTQKLANPLGEMPIGQKNRAGLNNISQTSEILPRNSTGPCDWPLASATSQLNLNARLLVHSN